MRLWWCPATRAVRVLWMIEELGIPCERVRIDIRDEAAKAAPAFRRASPMGKVPAIEEGETRLWDSGAICAWLADRHPEAGLAPAINAPDRGAWLQWLMFNNSVIEPAMLEKFVPDAPRNPSAFGWGSFDAMIAVLRDGIGQGPWILGERFSAADVMLGSAVVAMRRFNILPAEPVLHAYADRCLARPAHQRALAADQA